MNTGGRTLVHEMDVGEEDTPLHFTHALFDPRATTTYIPDMNTSPAILTNANVTDNITITNFNTSGALIMLPKFRDGTIIRGAIWQAGSILTLGSFGTTALTTTTFIPELIYPKSRTLTSQYNFLRVTRFLFDINSSSTGISNNSLAGTLSGASFNNLNDLTTYTNGELGDVSITSTDNRLNIPVQEGLSYRCGPELIAEFTPPSSNSLAANPAYTQSSRTSGIAVTASYFNTVQPLPIPKNIMNQRVGVYVVYTLTNSSATLSATIDWRFWAANYSSVGGSIGAFQVPGFECGASNVFPQVISPASTVTNVLFCTLDFVSVTGTMLPNVVAIGTNTANITGSISYSVDSYESYNIRGLGPGAIIYWTGLAPSQSLTINCLIGYEAIPNSALTKDVKTNFYHHRSRATGFRELPLSESLFNNDEAPLDRVMTMRQAESVPRELFSARAAIRYALSFRDLVGYGKKFLSYVPRAMNTVAEAAPIVGSFFGPEGTAFGSVLGGVASSIGSTGANINEALGIRNASGYGHMRHHHVAHHRSHPYANPNHYSSNNWNPVDYENWATQLASSISPPVQEDLSSYVPPVQKSTILELIMRAYSTERSTRPNINMAYFPTITSSSVAGIEKLFVTEKPIKSRASNDQATNTTYNSFVVTETHKINGVIRKFRTTVHITDDIHPNDAPQLAKIMSLMGREDCYLTLSTKGTMHASSAHMALVAACMGLPSSGVAFTGEIDSVSNGGSIFFGAIADLLAKKTACTASKLKLISTTNAKPQEVTLPYGEDTISVAEMYCGMSPNPGWELAYISTAGELAAALLAAHTKDFLLGTIGKGESKHLEFKSFESTASVKPTEITLSTQAEQFKELNGIINSAISKVQSMLESLVMQSGSKGGQKETQDTLVKKIVKEVKEAFYSRKLKVPGQGDFTFSQLADDNTMEMIGNSTINLNQALNWLRGLGYTVYKQQNNFVGMAPIATTLSKYKTFISDLKSMGAKPAEKKGATTSSTKLKVARRDWLEENQEDIEPSSKKQKTENEQQMNLLNLAAD